MRGPSPKKSIGLDEARIPVAASLVKGNEDGCLGLEVRIGVERIEDVLHIGLEEVDLRALRMAVEQAVGLAERYRRQGVVGDVRNQVGGILDVRRANRRVAHDRCRVLERIADLAVGHAESVRGIGQGRRREVRIRRVCRHRHVRQRDGVIVGAAEVGPADLLVVQRIADRPHGRRQVCCSRWRARRSGGSRGWCC